MTLPTADVVVIGAGVVGTAIARTLARYALDIVLLDAAPDVGTGTSKANTAILHTGFDAKPGSLESRLLRRGSALLRSYAAQAGIPVERTGALLVAWTPEQLAALPGIEAKARDNGYPAIRPLRAGELYQREPGLGPGAAGALEIPDESIICPWTTPLAFATEAVAAGVRLLLSTQVTGACSVDGRHELATTRGPLRARWVINAAGLGSDLIDAMFGGGGFTITPRRGELIVFDKLARPLLRSVLLPVPTARTKGVLVAPTVYGNVLLGPTAQDIPDRSDVATTAGRAPVAARGRAADPARAGAGGGHLDLRRAARRHRARGLPGLRRRGGGGTRARAASGRPGCPRRSASPSTSPSCWRRPGSGWCRGPVPRPRRRPCRTSGRRESGRTRTRPGSRPTRPTARSSATASGSAAARSGTRWPARYRPRTRAAWGAGRARATGAARGSTARPRYRA